MQVFWARLSGYPAWPARLCTEEELEMIVAHKPKKGLVQPIGVVYLGDLSRGWVSDNAFSEFTPESFSSKFIQKKFRSDLKYRKAVIEAIRLSVFSGSIYPDDIMEMVSSCSDIAWTRADTCMACAGTGIFQHTNIIKLI